MNQYNKSNDPLSLIFTALAHPIRRNMLSKLKSGILSVKDLSEPYDMSPPAITKHLKILERAGLISREQNAQLRLSKLEVEPLKEATEWLEDYKQLWIDRFERLDEILENLKENEG